MLASIRAQEGNPKAAATPMGNVARLRADSVVAVGAAQPPATLADIELTVITTKAGLEALEAEWNTLFAECGRDIHVFQSFNWIWHWSDHFLPPAGETRGACELHIVTGRSGGHLALVCPFALYRRGGLTTLSFAGDPVSQYGDVLLDQRRGGRDLLERAWSFIVENSGADALIFRKVRADSNLASLLTHSDARVTDRQIAPYLDLSSAPDYETYEQRYSTKARKNRRRLVRRFEDRGPAYVHTHKSGERASELAALAVSLKRAWLKHRGLVSPALANPATREFFASVTADAKRPVGALVTHLASCGDVVALEVAFDCKGRRAVHIIVYALKFERAGVGHILMERSVRNAITDGLGVFDLMAPGDAYKLDWADGSVEVLDWAHGMTLRGRAFTNFYLVHARGQLKRAAIAAGRWMRYFAGSNADTSHS